ncbi:hypothetical protein ABEX25_27805 [Paenibacillus thiaminolyticus]
MTAFSRHDDPAHDKKSKTGTASGLAMVENHTMRKKTDPASSRA